MFASFPLQPPTRCSVSVFRAFAFSSRFSNVTCHEGSLGAPALIMPGVLVDTCRHSCSFGHLQACTVHQVDHARFHDHDPPPFKVGIDCHLLYNICVFCLGWHSLYSSFVAFAVVFASSQSLKEARLLLEGRPLEVGQSTPLSVRTLLTSRRSIKKRCCRGELCQDKGRSG